MVVILKKLWNFEEFTYLSLSKEAKEATGDTVSVSSYVSHTLGAAGAICEQIRNQETWYLVKFDITE